MVSIKKIPNWKSEYPFSQNSHSLACGNMNYVDEGKGEVILFLHGNPTWSFYYRRLITSFSETHRCIAIDHIGCGLSDKPQDYNYCLKSHIDNALSLVEKLDLKNITLVVHDWGGAIGMGLAERCPDRIKQFVIFNTAAFLDLNIPKSIALCKVPILGEFIVRGLNGFAHPAIYMASKIKGTMTPERIAGYLAPYNSWASRVAVHRFVKDIPLKESHQTYSVLKNIEDGLKQFTNHPMLIIWGEKDFCFTNHFRDVWVKRFPGADLHSLPNAGHYVVEDAHDTVKTLMKTFLES